ncbi:RcnB family protein [Phenylobacterium sp.]|uniref:RcnB family protein n=1 Tax=Phenylobacterium sp. TaxID=1871053 RepID=UPI002DF187A4|nr:RcnB family protein [Phenylobacterium sp.]
MRRLFRIFAVVAAAACLAGGGALAREHGDGRGDRHGEGRGGGREEHGGRGGEQRGGPPPWAGRGGGRWERPPADSYGPPPGAYPPPPGYYQPRRGGFLPPQARGGVVQDYGRYRLRQPPRGYAWVRSGRAMMLMDMNTGQVFDVIPD